MRRSAFRAQVAVALAAAAFVVGACGAPRQVGSGRDPSGSSTASAHDGFTARPQVAGVPAVRLLLAGDLMLGRGMATVVGGDPDGVFADVRHLVAGADIAGANLESPLTVRAHVAANPNALEADPAVAEVVAGAGFDVLSVANNHAGDAGRASVLDTIAAVGDAGMTAVGGGADLEEAERPVYVEHGGVRLAFLAFDATRGGLAAGTDAAGIVHWDESRARVAVSEARAAADVVVVSIHGGVEYLADTDPGQWRLAETLASWGVDVVWGHGSHVLQPVSVVDRAGGGSTLVATSLGNLVFDQQRDGTTRGGLLEVLADGDGVVAFRLGITDHADRRVHLDRWELPAGDAVLLGNGWWTPVRMLASDDPAATSTDPAAAVLPGFEGDVVDARVGDATGDGQQDVVVSFRRRYRPTLITEQYPDRVWADVQGRAAHLGVYALDGQPKWVAGTMFRPVARVAVCDGTLALAFDQLDSPGVVATSAWRWEGFGFTVPIELPGPGEPVCIDIDGDGRLDPYLVRSAP